MPMQESDRRRSTATSARTAWLHPWIDRLTGVRVRLSRPLAGLVVALGLALSWGLTYALGGAGVVPPHWFYLPILFAGARFGLVGAGATAVAAGFLGGPLTPLDVGSGTPQRLSDWATRAGLFLLIGLVMSSIVTRLRRSLEREVAVARRERDLAAREAAVLRTVSDEFRTPLTASVLAAVEEQPVAYEEEVPLQEVCAEAVRRMGDLDGLARVRIACERDARWVLGSRAVLRLLLAHLVENALKFSPPGSPVDVRARTGGLHAVEVAVRDRGPGISREFLPRAFEPFTQEDPSMGRAKGGLGIGLFVAQRLAGRMGGSLELRRPAEGGTEAIVRIPQPRGTPVSLGASLRASGEDGLPDGRGAPAARS